MMFSSNQILEVSGNIAHSKELQTALKFALELSGDMELFTRNYHPAKCVFQITEQNHFCVGWAFHGIPFGWSEFPFDFDLEKISAIIEKHLSNQKIEKYEWDGSYRAGFLMTCIPSSFEKETDGVKSPLYGIVKFAPYTCFYAK